MMLFYLYQLSSPYDRRQNLSISGDRAAFLIDDVLEELKRCGFHDVYFQKFKDQTERYPLNS